MKLLILLGLGFFAVCADSKFKTPAFVINEEEPQYHGNNRSPHVHASAQDHDHKSSEHVPGHNDLLVQHNVRQKPGRPQSRPEEFKRKVPSIWDPMNWKDKIEQSHENKKHSHIFETVHEKHAQRIEQTSTPKQLEEHKPEHKKWEPVHKDAVLKQMKKPSHKFEPVGEKGLGFFRDEANEISTVKPNLTEVKSDTPPDHTKLIAMARYVMHSADWAAVGTISNLPAINGFPFVNVKSVVDGSLANSTGIPYFYMAPADFTARDLMKNSRATVMLSLEETRYCESNKWDPEDPRCTRLMLTGKMMRLKEQAPEYKFAKAALFERHPAMATWPTDHDWFVAKLKIAQIAMVDWFGGAKYIKVRDYLAYNYTGTDVINLLYPQAPVTFV